MKCAAPIQLKSGLVVPCGKCELCLSHRRDEWSARLQLHTLSYDSMPFFVTLTYKPEMLVYGAEVPTLVKSDVRLFIKRIKDKYQLYNSDFTYFGCGEYGDKFDRPHFHLLLFGFPQLEEWFERSIFFAEDKLAESWTRDGKNIGFVNIGRAEWSGIHYVTKYVLKYLESDYNDKERPFIIYTRGIGYRWLDSQECKYLMYKIHNYCMPEPCCELDYTSPETLRDTSGTLLRQLSASMPRLVCTTPQGNKIALPRYFRKKLIGSFEHFKDSPYWYYDFLTKLHEASAYTAAHGDYDAVSGVSYHQQIVDFAIRKIHHRLITQQYEAIRNRTN